MAAPSPPTDITVCTYNVLSDKLASAEHFVACPPAFLASSYRLERVKSQLRAEIAKGSIICLQELSHGWTGQLHAHFLSLGYYLVSSLYGNEWNGHMGAGIAFPTAAFELVQVDLCRISEKIAKPPKAPKRSACAAFVQKWLVGPAEVALRALRLAAAAPPPSPLIAAHQRWNNMVSVRLSAKAAGAHPAPSREFSVSTYHMPCKYKESDLMYLHALAAVGHARAFAGARPMVLAGDFNLKPESEQYALLMGGSAPPKGADVSVHDAAGKYLAGGAPSLLRSAYAMALGAEPPYTNSSVTGKEKEAFAATLDYIFLSPEWDVEGVRSLEGLVTAPPTPQPNQTEPSDHLLIAASLRLARPRPADAVATAAPGKGETEATAGSGPAGASGGAGAEAAAAAVAAPSRRRSKSAGRG